MKKIFKRILILILALTTFSVINVDATYKYVDRKTHIGAGLNIVGSIYVDETDSGYYDASSPKVYIDGISDLQLSESDVHLSSYGNGYKLDYRGYLHGEIAFSLRGKFEQAGFGVEIGTDQKLHVHKYVSGTLYFTRDIKNECNKWGMCIWKKTPSHIEER